MPEILDILIWPEDKICLAKGEHKRTILLETFTALLRKAMTENIEHFGITLCFLVDLDGEELSDVGVGEIGGNGANKFFDWKEGS